MKIKDLLIENPNPITYFPWVDHVPKLQSQLLNWQELHGRNSLPWRSSDPYRVWISEIMLQQTQVSTGLVRFPQWLERFPDLKALSSASLDEVLEAWEGLGYYARARNLHKTACMISEKWEGNFPSNRLDRLSLPGIGPSTASAIGAFAFGKKEAIYDGNVARVWSRWWGDRAPDFKKNSEKEKFWWGWVQIATPENPSEIRSWTQGMMDLGATVCTPKNPKCEVCPWRDSCRAFALGQQEKWPKKSKKLEVEKMSIHWGLLFKNGSLAMVQRPLNGIWGGLWTPLELEEQGSQEKIHEGNHNLSHKKINYSINILKSEEVGLPSQEIEWVDPSRMDTLALPRPLRKWWSSLSTTQKNELFRN